MNNTQGNTDPKNINRLKRKPSDIAIPPENFKTVITEDRSGKPQRVVYVRNPLSNKVESKSTAAQEPPQYTYSQGSLYRIDTSVNLLQNSNPSKNINSSKTSLLGSPSIDYSVGSQSSFPTGINKNTPHQQLTPHATMPRGNNNTENGKPGPKSKETDNLVQTLQTEINNKFDSMKETLMSDIKALLRDPETGIIQRLEIVEGKCTSVTQKVTQEGGLAEEVKRLTEKCHSMEQIVVRCESAVVKCEQMTGKMNRMAKFIDKQDKKIKSMQGRITSNSAKHLTNELVVGGIKETPKEDMVEQVRQFFIDKVKITPHERDIITAHRIPGRKKIMIEGNEVTLPRRTVVKCSPFFRTLAMQNAKVLKGLFDDELGFKFFVAPHLTEAMREVHNKYKDQIAEIREKNKNRQPKDKISYRIAGSHLYVENKIIRDDVYPPRPADIMNVHPKDQAKLDAIQVYEVRPVKEMRSVFSGVGVVVKSFTDVRNAYIRVCQDYDDADHFPMAYAFRDDKGIMHKGQQDDDEHGASSRIAQKIQNSSFTDLAIFCPRVYGGIQVGTNRFRFFSDLAQRVLDEIMNDQDTEPENPEDRNTDNPVLENPPTEPDGTTEGQDEEDG